MDYSYNNTGWTCCSNQDIDDYMWLERSNNLECFRRLEKREERKNILLASLVSVI